MSDDVAGSGCDLEKLNPLLRGGAAAPFKKMSRYLKQGAAGEVSHICNKCLTSLHSARCRACASRRPRRCLKVA